MIWEHCNENEWLQQYDKVLWFVLDILKANISKAVCYELQLNKTYPPNEQIIKIKQKRILWMTKVVNARFSKLYIWVVYIYKYTWSPQPPSIFMHYQELHLIYSYQDQSNTAISGPPDNHTPTLPIWTHNDAGNEKAISL